MPWLLALVAVSLIFYGGKYVQQSVESRNLYYIDAADFGVWWPLMSDALLVGLNTFFRQVEIAGGSAWLSDDDGALGRYLGEGSHSQHNVDLWGEVRAADVVVVGIGLDEAEQIARDIGVFSGIGLYTDWASGGGIHLDVRADRTPENPATWSRVAGQYLGIKEAYA